MSSRAFTKQIFRWLAQINADRELPPSCTKIAVALAGYFNEDEGGKAWPGFQTIAHHAGLSKSVVVDGLRLLQAHGHVRVAPGSAGRGHSSHYWMVEKGREPDLFDAPKRSEEATPKRSVQPPKRSAGRPDSSISTEREGSKTLPDDASRDLKRQSGEAKPKPKPKAAGEAFEAFWRVYPRKVGKDAAHRAFAAAVKAGADAQAIIAGAARFAHERAGQDPAFTPHPKTWLRDGRWLDEPAPSSAAPMIDGKTGEIVAQPRPPPRAARRAETNVEMARRLFPRRESG